MNKANIAARKHYSLRTGETCTVKSFVAGKDGFLVVLESGESRVVRAKDFVQQISKLEPRFGK